VSAELKPPASGDDPELDAVEAALRRLDPAGERTADVLRETYDQLYDGQRTGRFRWEQLRKTEKTYMGTIVEINLHREFAFEDGLRMDYRIAELDVDCKFSQTVGGWEIPPEAYEGRHLCLLLSADDYASRWHAGLVRADPSLLGSPNRDRKRKLLARGLQHVRWLHRTAPLPENLLLHIDDATRDRILDPVPAARRAASGQAKINMLFRLVQRRIVNRASVLTVAQQKDALKRARDARLPRHLGHEGILVLGHQERDPIVAAELGLPRPRKGEFVSARVVPAEPEFGGPTAEIEGRRWRLAEAADAVTPAPSMPRGHDEDG
jgi:Restriction endonuclease NaeI